MQSNLEEHVANFIVSTVIADCLALWGAGASAGPVMTGFESGTYPTED